MFICQRVLLLSFMLFLTSCLASSNVSIMDSSVIGHRDVQFIVKNKFLDDPVGVGTMIIDNLNKSGYFATIKVPEIVNESSSGSGSAFVVADGYWVSNEHVIAGKNSITVNVGKNSYPAKIVAKDAHLDLALLQAETGNLKPFKLSMARHGEEIYVIGYPLTRLLGASARVTTGVVSSLQGLGGDTNNIQISAPIQPGNSGGPVINAKWELVGVAVGTVSTMKAAESFGVIPQGINFAVSPGHVKGFLLQNGVNPAKSGVNSLEQAIASSGLVVSKNEKSTQAKKRYYFLDYNYGVYWDIGYNLSVLNIELTDMESGELIAQSQTGSMYGMGVAIPVRQAVKDILKQLGLEAM